ncbi:MAG: hypothetical protein H6706_19605 [Myxococcales bacterium]|nr:hypothetical protein [Myxococcales bacterium]
MGAQGWWLALALVLGGCAEDRATPDVEPADLGLEVVSFQAHTDGGCDCRGEWDDANGDGIEDPSEYTSGYEAPSAGLRLKVRGLSSGTFRFTLRAASAVLLGDDGQPQPAEADETLAADDLPGTLEVELVAGEDKDLGFPLPTSVGRLIVGPSAVDAGTWRWRVKLEVDGPAGQGTVILETEEFVPDFGALG